MLLFVQKCNYRAVINYNFEIRNANSKNKGAKQKIVFRIGFLG